MLELKTKMPVAGHPQNSLITFQIFFGNGKSQPDPKEKTAISGMAKSLSNTNFNTKLDWQLAKAESLAG